MVRTACSSILLTISVRKWPIYADALLFVLYQAPKQHVMFEAQSRRGIQPSHEHNVGEKLNDFTRRYPI